MPEGSPSRSTIHFHVVGEFHLFINKNGELKYEVIDNESMKNKMNNKAYMLLEEYNINALSRSFLGSNAIEYEFKPSYVFDDGKIYLTKKTLTIEELEKLLLQHNEAMGKRF